jgi:ribosomal protein S18 acetylase RimI-like enzyme
MTTATLQSPLRLEPAHDLELVRRLHAAVCAETFAALGLPAEALEPLVHTQFTAQQAGYRTQFPTSTDLVVWAGDQPVGRCWVDENATRIRILDLAIVPDHRRRGFARLALESVIQTAERRGVLVALNVRAENAPARALYRSLGFEADPAGATDPAGDLPLVLSPSSGLTDRSDERPTAHG